MFKILEAEYDADYGGLLAMVEIKGEKHCIGQQCTLEGDCYIIDKDCNYQYDDEVNKSCEYDLFADMVRAAAKMANIKLKVEIDILGGIGYQKY